MPITSHVHRCVRVKEASQPECAPRDWRILCSQAWKTQISTQYAAGLVERNVVCMGQGYPFELKVTFGGFGLPVLL